MHLVDPVKVLSHLTVHAQSNRNTPPTTTTTTMDGKKDSPTSVAISHRSKSSTASSTEDESSSSSSLSSSPLGDDLAPSQTHLYGSSQMVSSAEVPRVVINSRGPESSSPSSSSSALYVSTSSSSSSSPNTGKSNPSITPSRHHIKT